MRRLTTEEFIRRVRLVHGDKYDYSKVEYKGDKVRVCIICPIHGEFWQTPHNHLKGYGCWDCARNVIASKNKGTKRKRKLVYGVGINDTDANETFGKCYNVWHSMMWRCYAPKKDSARPTYVGCSVCNEWITLSKFKAWFDENYVNGYVLDKDILFKGNKVYSPDTCCFVPQEINALFTKRQRYRGIYPIGVQKWGDDIIASVNIRGSQIRLGAYSTPEEAFQAYKTAKEAYIKEVANEYYSDGKITKRVYDALMRYEVEITD